jgi:hypothetical protein
VGEIARCDPQIGTGVRRTSIITVFEQNTYCNVQNLWALIMSHNQARVIIFNKIINLQNTLLLNRLIYQRNYIYSFLLIEDEKNIS